MLGNFLVPVHNSHHQRRPSVLISFVDEPACLEVSLYVGEVSLPRSQVRIYLVNVFSCGSSGGNWGLSCYMLGSATIKYGSDWPNGMTSVLHVNLTLLVLNVENSTSCVLCAENALHLFRHTKLGECPVRPCPLPCPLVASMVHRVNEPTTRIPVRVPPHLFIFLRRIRMLYVLHIPTDIFYRILIEAGPA